MSWEVALFIALPLFFIIGNIMLVKHTAKMKMPSLKDHQPEQARQQGQSASAEDEENDKQ